MHAAREKVIVRFQPRLSDPGVNGVARRGRDLELHWALSLVLHNHRPGRDMIAMANIAHAQADQVAGAQLAVDAQIKECRLPQSALHQQTHTDGPDLPELERRLLTNQLALVPRFWTMNSMLGFHDDLLAVEGDPILLRSSPGGGLGGNVRNGGGPQRAASTLSGHLTVSEADIELRILDAATIVR
jgi:hypothetical protein